MKRVDFAKRVKEMEVGTSVEEMLDRYERKREWQEYFEVHGEGRDPNEVYDEWVNATIVARLGKRLERAKRMGERLDSEFEKRIGKTKVKNKIKMKKKENSMSEVRLTEEDKIELEDMLEEFRNDLKINIILPEEERIEIKNRIKADIIKIYEYIDKEENTFEAYKEKHGAGRDEYEVYQEWYSKPYPPEIQALIDKNWEDIREYLEEKYPEVDDYAIGDLTGEWFEWYKFLYRKLGMAWLRGE